MHTIYTGAIYLKAVMAFHSYRSRESSRLRREVVAMLKELQNKAYICCDECAFRSCLNILKDVNDLLSEKVSPKLPLQSSRLRTLPSRKRKFKLFGKFHHRVGKFYKTP